MKMIYLLKRMTFSTCIAGGLRMPPLKGAFTLGKPRWGLFSVPIQNPNPSVVSQNLPADGYIL